MTEPASNALERQPEVGFLNVESGELLPASIDNAAAAIDAARTMKGSLDDIIREATAWLADQAARQGTKTFNAGTTVKLTGGPTTTIDAIELMQLLRECDCPEDRIDQAVKTEITYKVDRAVLRQLAAANPDYKAAIELATRTIEKPYSASIGIDHRKDTKT